MNGLVCKELGLVGDNVLVAFSSNYFDINFVWHVRDNYLAGMGGGGGRVVAKVG